MERKKNQMTKPAASAVPQGHLRILDVKRLETPAADAFSVYSNDIQVQTSPWDLRLTFGEIMTYATQDDPTLKVKVLGELRLSPQLAKKLTLILIEQIDFYEKNIGEIPSPNNAQVATVRH